MPEVVRKNLTIREIFGYEPTVYQEQVHVARLLQPYLTLVAHRRFGKTECGLMELLTGAFTCQKRLPIYSYIAPTLKQAKQIAWEKLVDYCNRAKAHGVTNIRINKSDTTIKILRGGSVGIATIDLAGWEEPDSLRGPYCDGMIIDEAADMKPGVWGKILAPKLADRHGWAIITGTVKGLDQFFDFFQKGVAGEGKEEFWNSLYFPIELTRGNIPWLDEYALNSLRSGVTATEWDQEMNCNWNASSDNILIPLKAIEVAKKRNLRDTYKMSGHTLGVDVKGTGADKICVARRWGNRFCGRKQFDEATPQFLAAYIIREVRNHDIDAVFLDGTGGYASGVMEALRAMGCPCPVYEIQFQSAAMDDAHYYNIRAEMWDKMAKCIELSGHLPDDRALDRELSCVSYSYKGNRLLIEPKESIRKKIGRSPDGADAYALTFAYPISKRLQNFNSNGNNGPSFVRDDFNLRT